MKDIAYPFITVFYINYQFRRFNDQPNVLCAKKT